MHIKKNRGLKIEHLILLFGVSYFKNIELVLVVLNYTHAFHLKDKFIMLYSIKVFRNIWKNSSNNERIAI